jgi:nitrite reductase (NO-forming)
MKNTSFVFAFLFVFLFSACGSDQGGNSGAQSKPKVASGEDIYKRTCLACHMATGEGLPNTFPPLAKSDYLTNKENTIKQVLKGSSGVITVNGKTFNNTMPLQNLSDEEVAAVLTYVYGNFGNSGGTVTPDEVKQMRSK